MVGIKDNKLSEQLQLDSKLTSEKAITKTRQSETVKKQQMFLQESKSDPPPAHVGRLSKGKGKDSKEDMKKTKKPTKSKNGETPGAQCSRCLGQLHPKRLPVCPARESKCNKFSKGGHWAKACRSQSDKRVGEVNFPRKQEQGEFFLGELTELSAVQRSREDLWKAKNLNWILVQM